MTVDAGNLSGWAGVFIEVESDVLNQAVLSHCRSDGQWYALSRRARTIVYSSERVSLAEAPSTYEELAGPEWKGRLCLRNSSNTYTQSLVASLIGNVGYGEALRIVSGWADNAEILSNDVIALNSVRDGLCDVAIVNHYYLARLMEDDLTSRSRWCGQTKRGAGRMSISRVQA